MHLQTQKLLRKGCCEHDVSMHVVLWMKLVYDVKQKYDDENV